MKTALVPRLMPIHLRTLGALDLRDPAGRELRSVLVQPKRIALLTYLAVAAPRGFHRRDSLVALLWPEQDQAHARGSLRQALHSVRQALGNDVVLTRGDEVSLAEAALRCDVPQLEAAIRAGELERAVTLYGGEFLPGFFLGDTPEFEHWVEEERSRLSRAYAVALERLAEQTSHTDVATAAGWWRRLAAHDPYSPRVALGLMQALAAAGDTPAAIRHAEDYRALLQEELGAEPDPQVGALAERLRRLPVPAPVPELPVRIPAVQTGPPAERPAVTEGDVVGSALRAHRRWLRYAALAVVALGGVALVWSLTALRAEAAPLGIAVLPFSSPGGDPRHELLAEGLTEELRSALGMIPELRVITDEGSSDSARVRPVRELAEQLQISRVVQGSVAGSRNGLRVRVQVVDPFDGDVAFSREYGGPAAGVFRVDDEISQDVAHALGVSLPPRVRERLARPVPSSLAAFEEYRRGVAALNDWNPSALDSAIAALERAVAADSSYAAARAELANAYLEKADVVDPRGEYRNRARVLTETALYLDPELPDAYIARGNLTWTAANNFPHEHAIRDFARAAELQPSLAPAHDRLSLIYIHIGLLEQAAREADVAVALEPLNQWARFRVGHVLATQQRYQEALEVLARVPPQVAPWLRFSLMAEALLYLGRPLEARALLDQGLVSLPDDPWILSTRALVRARLGDRAGTLADIEAAGGRGEEMAHWHHGEFNIGIALALLGEADAAVSSLQAAAANGFPCYPRFANDPFLKRLQADERYAALLRDLRGRREGWNAQFGRSPASPGARPAS